ncbi:MAG: type II secretion system F family protein, partial [Gammaproteobacteria bacterium]
MPLEMTAAQQPARPAGKSTEPGTRRLRGRKKAGMKDRIFFTEQLSLLLETGTPLHTALKAICSQVENPGMRAIIDGLTEHVTDGKSFSWALAQYPEMFPVTYVNLVAAAEQGGFMDKVLLELMNMDEKRDE